MYLVLPDDDSVVTVLVETRNSLDLVSFICHKLFHLTCRWETTDDTQLDVFGILSEMELQLSGDQVIECCSISDQGGELRPCLIGLCLDRQCG